MRIKVTRVLQFDRTDVTKYESKLIIWFKKLIGSYVEPLIIYKYQVRCESKLIDVFDPIMPMMLLKGSHYWQILFGTLMKGYLITHLCATHPPLLAQIISPVKICLEKQSLYASPDL